MIDSHHHLWHYSPQEYPWIQPGSVLADHFGITQLQQVTAAAGVSGTIVVQARQSIGETIWLLKHAAKYPIVRGVVGWLPLTDGAIGELLEEWQFEEKLVGLRHVLQEEPDAYFSQKSFHRGLAALAETHLRYDLLIYERQLPAAIAMIDQHPQLPVIVDHIAKPTIENGRISQTWKRNMTELASREHVIGVKISGMATEVRDTQIDEATLRAYFEETLHIFGPQRVMFGSDWPVCLLRLNSYQQSTDMMRRFVSPLSESEQDGIIAANAQRCYGL